MFCRNRHSYRKYTSFHFYPYARILGIVSFAQANYIALITEYVIGVARYQENGNVLLTWSTRL